MNESNEITLNIKDIALLKQNPKRYYENLNITRTHDGTSSTPVKSTIQKFVKEYSQSPYFHHAITDKDGKIFHEGRLLFTEYYDNESLRTVAEQIGNDMNIITTVPDEDDEHQYYDGFDMINKTEVEMLTEQDADGNYLVRSNTIVSLNGESTTVVRNNKFSEKDHKKLSSLYDEYQEDVNKWFNNVYMAEMHNVMEEYHDTHGEFPSNEIITRETVKRVGDVSDYINGSNWGKRFEEECNVKLKVSKNTNVEYDGTPRDDLLDQYSEDLERL